MFRFDSESIQVSHDLNQMVDDFRDVVHLPREYITFNPANIQFQHQGFHTLDEDLFGDIRVSYRDITTPGSTYRPDTGEIDFMVEVDPQQVRGMKLVLFENEDITASHRTIELKKFGDGRYCATISGDEVKPGMMYGYIPDSKQNDQGLVSWLIDPYAKSLVRTTFEVEADNGEKISLNNSSWLASRISNDVMASRIFGKQVENLTDEKVDQLINESGFDHKKCREVAELLKSSPHVEAGQYLPPRSVVIDMPKEENPASSVKLEYGSDRIYYEMHVWDTMSFHDGMLPEDSPYRGKQGTFEFLKCPEFISYVKELGITTLELMPVQMGDDEWALASAGKINAWNYNPISFFALEPEYCHSKDPHGQIREFKDAVSTLRESGIEVVIDYVTGHTHERGARYTSDAQKSQYVQGPITGFRGLSDKDYYRGDLDATGCENTVRNDTDLSRKVLISSRDHLLYALGADGLRVDQATILGRTEDLSFQKSHPFLYEFSNVRKDKFIVGEPNDAVGFHEADFPDSYDVWTYRNRDAARNFFKHGDNVRNIVDRLAGHSDIFGRNHNRAIHFAAIHDGLTNFDAAEMDALKARAFISMSVFAPGPFLLLRGDEVLRTQDSNSNAYNNPEYLGVEWDLDVHDVENSEMKKDFRSYVQAAIQLRKDLGVFNTRRMFSTDTLDWYRADGRPIGAEAWEEPNENVRGPMLWRAWEEQRDFVGALYAPNGIDGENDSLVYSVVSAHEMTHVRLPETGGDNFAWELVADSTMGYVSSRKSEPLTGEGETLSKDESDLLFSGDKVYPMEGPGMLVFRKVKLK